MAVLAKSLTGLNPAAQPKRSKTQHWLEAARIAFDAIVALVASLLEGAQHNQNDLASDSYAVAHCRRDEFR